MAWAVAGRQGGAKFGKGIGSGVTPSPEYLTERAREVAIQTGISTEDILRGGHKVQEITGDMEYSVRVMELLGQASVATGSEIDDLAQALSAANKMFGVKSIEDSTKVLAQWTAQGKEGAIEIKDWASYAQEITAAASGLGMKQGPESLMELGNIFQLARYGTGSGAAAKTAMLNMLRNITMKSESLRKDWGVNLYEGTGREKKLRGLREWLPEMIMKVGGQDLGKIEEKTIGIGKLLNIRGGRAPQALMTA
ncbi:MAG: phage tail tape measure protein, partial [Candidatus Omnitrophica bacterium]|nr:phage tail tape measure protein [Candidatus Omnitrophota bacterium]